MSGIEVVADAVVASLWHGAAVAVVVAIVGRTWRADAALRCGLATVGLWALAAWFAVDIATGLSGVGPSGVAASGPAAPVFTAPPLVGWLWAAGVTMQSGRLGLSWWCVRRWRRRSAPLGRALSLRFAGLAERMGLRRVPGFAVSIDVTTPLVTGLLRPLVLLPSRLVVGHGSALSPQQLEALVAHELAHLARADPWLHTLQSLIGTVLFHNPAAWWLAREAARAREDACDDRAVAATGDAVGFARALLSLSTSGAVTFAALAANGGVLKARVTRLVSPRPRPRPARAAALCVVVAAGAWFSVRPAVVPTPPAEPAVAPGPARPVAVAATHGANGLAIAWLPPAVRAHEAEIVAAAERHGVDPDLVAIVAMVESGGDPQAVSSKGARGLMQLMPQTARKVARDRGLPTPTRDRLAQPAYNLDVGAAVLAQQLRTFAPQPAVANPDGEGAPAVDDIERVAAAYNAGASRVRDWLAEGRPLPPETVRYQARIGQLWQARDSATAPPV